MSPASPTRCCGHTCQHADTHTPQTCPGVSKADCAQRGPTLPCTQRAHDCLTTRHGRCPAPVSPQGWLRHTVVSSRGGVATVLLPHYSRGGPGTVPRAAASREPSPRFCSSMVQVSTPSDMDGRRDALSSVVAVQRLSSHPRPPPSTGVLTTTSVTAWTLISPPAVPHQASGHDPQVAEPVLTSTRSWKGQDTRWPRSPRAQGTADHC